MAVINSPYVGNARGKLGDAVLYRSKGNTIARAYNPEPKNRRTVSQQSQRSVFSAAVKFYARGVQNLFLFAFENKKPQESDYNAFMRYNANRGMYFGPQQNDDDTYPALGDFVLTRGSLGSFSQELYAGGPQLSFNVSGIQSAPTTLGELTAILIDKGLMEGDIITFLGITTDSGLGTPYNPVELGTEVPEWHLKQFTLDLASSDTLASLGFEASYLPVIRSLVITVFNFGAYDEGIASGAVVVSRQDGGLLRVSNTNLMLNEAASEALALGRSVTWHNVVMSSWNAEQLSILQGGISVNSVSPESGIRVAWEFSLPVTNDNLNNKGFITSQALSLSELANMLYMVASDDTEATFEISSNGVAVNIGASAVGYWRLDTTNARRYFYSVTDSGIPITFKAMSLQS